MTDDVGVYAYPDFPTTRQLPETLTLHDPAISPFSGCSL